MRPGARVSLMLGLALGVPFASAQPAVYRCGQSYQQAPCAQGRPVAVEDARSESQRREAQAAARDESRLGTRLERERLARERQTRPLAAVGIGAQASAAGASAPVKAKAKAKKRSKPGAAAAEQREDFIALEPAQAKTAKRGSAAGAK
jgi:hypothetical protein